MRKAIIIVNIIGFIVATIFMVVFSGMSPTILKGVQGTLASYTPEQIAMVVTNMAGILVTCGILILFFILSLIFCIVIKIVENSTEKRIQKKNEKVIDGATIEQNIEKENS